MWNIWRLRVDMALQAEESAFTPEQHLTVHCAMRTVASGTSFDLHGSVFIHKRTALLDVTIDAAFPRVLAQHRLIVRTVRIVTIRALHQSLWNPMMRRQCKLG